ncbi:phosphopantetheine-binding protein [Streptomyces sp. AP-93]|uniref:phosphopantetheine-binding protein n=1 Tax=Streptomyces sp. AP-93 TaxID=2929048 RepID=UPI001FAF2E18|nr:phosphopantetheine-binding protein [Streptomyces sp. AP-93]MCJ0874945.1 phosphopantetheine-binding protein [Streptomyces sp. AP-93]
MPDLREELTDAPYTPPADPLEKQVAEIIASVLDIDKVGREDSFYDLGGGSMQAIRICARAEQETGLTVDPLTLLENDRLVDFVAELRGANSTAATGN